MSRILKKNTIPTGNFDHRTKFIDNRINMLNGKHISQDRDFLENISFYLTSLISY